MLGWILFFVVLIMLIGAVPFTTIMLYNIKVVLRYKTNSFDFITYGLAKIKRGKDEVEHLKVLWKNISLPSPPSEAISLTKGGNKVVEIEVSQDGSARYMVKDRESGEFKSLTTNDRLFLANQMVTAQERKKVQWTELAQTVAVGLTLIILVMGSLALAPNVLDKFSTVMDKANQILAKEEQLLTAINQRLILTDEDIRNSQVVLSDESEVAPPE